MRKRPGQRPGRGEDVVSSALRRLRVFIHACLVVCLGVAMTLTGVAPAWADDASAGRVRLRIDAGTSTTINGTDDYTATVTIVNEGSTALGSGKLTILTNPRFSFDSSSLMQEWAEHAGGSDARLRRLNVTSTLGTADVESVPANSTRTVHVTTSASDAVMRRFTTWGPKPVEFRYTNDMNGTLASTTSFVTRTQDGLDVQQTPQLGMVVAAPLTTARWKATSGSIERLLTHDNDGNGSDSGTGSGTDAENPSAAARSAATNTVTTLSKADRTRQTALAATLKHHDAIQTVADPSYLRSFAGIPRTAALMQPDGFDLAFQAQNAQAYAWQDAGLTHDLWDAARATQIYHDVINDAAAPTPTTVAWQSRAPWTRAALTAAKEQGYAAVIAESGYEADTPSAVHTSKMTVATDAGDITVLNTQRDLSTLAQGTATTEKATAEGTETGRLARFVAQSAFYQMERPYESRTLLVSLGQSPDADDVDALMTKLEACPWLKLDTLDSLLQAEPSIDAAEANDRAASIAPLDAHDTASLGGQVASLAKSRSTITRFVNDILVRDGADGTDGAGSSPAPGLGAAGTGAAADDQAAGARRWGQALTAAYGDLALKAFSPSSVENATMTKAARQLGGGLLAGITVAQPDSINIVSQSAKMPVTIGNDHPYPVRIRFAAQTDSAQIVTDSTGDVTIPAHSEVQSTVDVHVLRSGKANVTIQLQDRAGLMFGASTSATITSVFQINDWSGYAILALAVLLGVVGLWRQFHRVKDPDE